MSTPKLLAKVKTTVEVQGHHLEQFIFELFGQRLEIVADQELSNEVWVTTVSKSTKVIDGKIVTTGVLSEYDAESFEDWKRTGHGSYITGTILEHMANEGIIAEGDYMIDVRW